MKRKPTRKRFTMLVTVSVPIAMSAEEARREVKTLITHQANWSADCDDVKAIGVRGINRRDPWKLLSRL